MGKIHAKAVENIKYANQFGEKYSEIELMQAVLAQLT